ncbi:hypothetical protein CFC21_083992 [Triticum aestivum]|uniref:Transcription repressor n=3 Tax=Triticum TaxID=4564 RepID=A0A9R0Y411_TRITD|nr:transcription repressor OFP8-like [Triticum dicoccoides]XP_044406538.1 transcription repressor OFP8-like [Triticum aestivum]KAF7079811.1 hypothetical protein CFC21_083992 [Triticum aestivum]VAI48061.1 unnamed protein product [Triticum turgidum subsp. durum]
MLSPGISVRKPHGGAGFALGCGCKDAKSVSVVSASPSPSGAGTSTTTETRRRGGRANPSASTTTDTLTSASSSSLLWEDAVAEFDCGDDGHFKRESSAATQSFSGLLRELNELEQSVVSWGRKSHRSRDKKASTPPLEHKQATMKSGDLKTGGAKDRRAGDSVEPGTTVEACVEVGLDGSVAVVKQSEDPLSDFRQSMVQMIVENGIIAGEELRQMLRRFLTLNAPHHHDVILRAFAEIWDAVFAASYVPAPATAPPHKHTRREEPAAGRPPMPPRTPPRHHHSPSPSAWRV